MRSTAVILVAGLLVGAGGMVLLTDAGPVSISVTTDTPASGDGSASGGDGDASGTSETSAGDGSDMSVDEETATETAAAETMSGPSDATITGAIAQAVQAEREANNVGQLNRTEPMDDLALHHSQDMAENGFFNNQAPWGDTLDDRMVQENVTCSETFEAENAEYLHGGQIIYRYQGDSLPPAKQIAEDAISQWRSDARDSRYLLLDGWSRMGVGTQRAWRDGEGTVYVTVVFC